MIEKKSIPPFRLLAKPLNEEARIMPKFKWAPDIIGTRHKLGGCPDFIQKEMKPFCSSCGNEMTFYAQLDSLNDDYVIADCGMIYVYICFECVEVMSFIQSS